MSLEKEFHDFAQEQREVNGRLLAGVENLKDFVTAVSRKVDDRHEEVGGKLDRHVESSAAHGLEAGRSAIKDVIMWIGAGMGMISLAVAIWKAAH